jgi:hypothetical protein
LTATEHGYSYYSRGEAEGNQVRVVGYFAREQTLAAIAPLSEFSLRFYGLGSGIELDIRAYPKRQLQPLVAPAHRLTTDGAAADVLTSPAAEEGHAPVGTVARARPTGPRRPIGGMVDPFGHPVVAPPEPPPHPPGGGGGALQAAVRVELFAPGLEEPVQTWDLPEEVTDQTRKLAYDPPGFPTPDAPVRRLGWWRVTVTPQGPGPSTIYVHLV